MSMGDGIAEGDCGSKIKAKDRRKNILKHAKNIEVQSHPITCTSTKNIEVHVIGRGPGGGKNATVILEL